jgi:F420-dependent oxidoreductase-like protein
MDIGLMVEGQNGLTWDRWIHIYQLAERLGFPSLFRSDHYFIGTQRQSLDTFASLAVAARETKNIRLGPLVSPMTFRSPVELARTAVSLDQLSGGRFVLGLGAGWHQPEHDAYGFRFPEVPERANRFVEGVEIVKHLWSKGPSSFDGRYFQLRDVDMQPKPSKGRPWLLIGGSGPKRTMPTAAKHADEWNTMNAALVTYAERVDRLNACCEAIGRDPATIKRSMMTFGLVGPNEQAVARAAEIASGNVGRGLNGKELLAAAGERGLIYGTKDQIIDQLGKLAELGVSEVEFQHMDFDNDEVPEFLAQEIVPAAKSL